MKRIIWLASYPKSGNTWVRVFLTNLRRGVAEPAHINDLDVTPIASDRDLLGEALSYDPEDLTHEEIDRLRPEAYAYHGSRADGTLFIKVHDAYTYLDDGRPLFPTEVTRGAIYLIRNPIDVCVSFAHHSGNSDFDDTISKMADPGFAVCSTPEFWHEQTRQRLLSWRKHVISWIESDIEIEVIRYEDLLTSPLATFTRVACFAGLPREREPIERAIALSSFEELHRQEVMRGFKERMPMSKSFFREGKAGTWRSVLTVEQVARIIQDQGDVMRRFGYLLEDGDPAY